MILLKILMMFQLSIPNSYHNQIIECEVIRREIEYEKNDGLFYILTTNIDTFLIVSRISNEEIDKLTYDTIKPNSKVRLKLNFIINLEAYLDCKPFNYSRTNIFNYYKEKQYKDIYCGWIRVNDYESEIIDRNGNLLELKLKRDNKIDGWLIYSSPDIINNYIRKECVFK